MIKKSHKTDIQSVLSQIWKAILSSDELSDEDDAIQFYSVRSLQERLLHLSDSYSNFEALHTVAIKTNPQPYILKKIAEFGYGLEAASLQEVKLAANTGIDPTKIIYNSPVKTQREIISASEKFAGLTLNANSIEELDRVPENHGFNLGLRINPMTDGETSQMYNVSGKNSKFGVPISDSNLISDAVKRFGITQFHIHSGSGSSGFSKSINGIKQVIRLAQLINNRPGSKINTINIGGGLPAGNDNDESLIWMNEYANLMQKEIPTFTEDFKLITEFGQWIHQHHGVAFSRVEYVRHFKDKSVAYLHIGADMFVRNVYTKENPLNILCLDKIGRIKSGEKRLYDVAGPLCFNGDYLSKNIMLPELAEGDIIAIYPCGANTYGLWSRHCSRNIPALFTDQIGNSTIKKVSNSWNPFLDNF